MKTILSLCLFALSSLAVLASPVAVTTSTITIAGKQVTVSIAPAQDAPYYRLAYGAKGKVSCLIFDKGISRSVLSLYCATTYAEVSAYAASNNLTGLPAQKAGQP